MRLADVCFCLSFNISHIHLMMHDSPKWLLTQAFCCCTFLEHFYMVSKLSSMSWRCDTASQAATCDTSVPYMSTSLNQEFLRTQTKFLLLYLGKQWKMTQVLGSVLHREPVSEVLALGFSQPQPWRLQAFGNWTGGWKNLTLSFDLPFYLYLSLCRYHSA